ncbi:MAG: hypothetical protein AB7O45_17150 [Alphaproteobacteria bacterium]
MRAPFRIIAALAALAAAAPARAETDCIIREFLTAKAVEDREPVGRTTRFVAESDRIHAYLRLDCSRVDPGRTAFQLRWIFNGRTLRSRDLTVGVSPNWRTWDAMPAIAGNGFVQLFDGEGTLVAEEAFTVSLR